GRVAVKVDPAVVFGTAGQLEFVFSRATLDQDSLYAADHAFADRFRLRVDLRLQALQAFLLEGHRGVIGEAGGRRARARTVDEAERLVEPQVFDQPHRGIEVRVCFAGEADDEIGRERDVRPGLTQFTDLLLVLEDRVP